MCICEHKNVCVFVVNLHANCIQNIGDLSPLNLKNLD